MSNWQQYLKSFEMYLSSERSLSKNTIEAYLRDVRGLAEFMPEEITPKNLKLSFD
ncbi:MAG: site-specific integrase [Bacteroidia bacterium]